MVIYIFKFVNEVLIVSFTVFIHIQSIPVNIQYTLSISLYHSLKPVSSVKLLRVKIDERLSFDDHISILCASHQIN